MLRLRSFIYSAALAVCVVVSQIQPAAAASVDLQATSVQPRSATSDSKPATTSSQAVAPPSQAAAVYDFASAQEGKPFQLGATGMSRYDCSGLVYRTYFETGLLEKISGRHLRARGYYNWFKSNGLVTSSPRAGDLVVWAHRNKPVSHIGIFVGYDERGQAMAISALINPYGVTMHRVNGIRIPFKAYLRVNLDS